MDGLEQYRPLVVRIARHLKKSLTANVELDDLIQAGMIGLNEALGKWSNTREAKFETFASYYIRGRMVDELRRQDPLARTRRSDGESIAFAPEEEALELPEPSPGPEGLLGDKQRALALRERIKSLPPRDRYVMELHYDHDMKLKDIGVTIGVSESRVSYMLKGIISRLKEELSGY